MAKPKHGRWNNCVSPSNSPPNSHLHSPVHAFARVFPSPALLSALAVIATTPPVVAGSPLPTSPPTFLCPFIERDNVDSASDIFSSFSSSTTLPSRSTSSPTPTQPTQYTKRGVIADRYVEGSDKLWRKTNSWTLYGSTCCSTSTTASTSATQSQSIASQTPMPTYASTTAAFDTSALPAGWDAASTPTSNTESTIILALAIVLAGSICVFMIGCLIWRRRKKRTKDIERKNGHERSIGDSQDNGREKGANGKMRMWAKASARWKSNIRQSARRRRKRPFGSSINRPLTPTLCDSQVSVVSRSVTSHRGSSAVERSAPSRSDAVSCLDDSNPPSDVQPDLPHPLSPPTYGASLVTCFSRLPSSSSICDPSSTQPTDHSAQLSNQPSFIEDEPLPYIPSSDGHVATDDKAQLARIQELASSPPITLDVTSASTTQSVSAPEWHEVEDHLEDFGIDLGEIPIPSHNFGLPPSFPPPPSKADIPFGYLDDDHHHYGEEDNIHIHASLSIPGPSGTPCGASPSAPPIDYPALEPSAPSLEDEDDLFEDWDGASSHVPEVSISADQDPIPPTVPFSARASSPPTRKSAARDNILPQYHP